jgi:homoserine O-acetyltransferase
VLQAVAFRLAMLTPASFALTFLACAPPQRTAHLGDVPLEGGGVLRDCRIGYRTFGRLNAARSNAVLVPSWAMGTSADLARQLGPGRLVDTSRHFVVAVDVPGNGVSSSPSNSDLQPDESFPSLTVRDVVEMQRRLLADVLHVDRLEAVVGISFGGMQAFEWAASHPGMIDAAVAIAASPRTTAAERERWLGSARALFARSRWRRAASALGRFEPRGAWGELLVDPHDYALQAQAVAAHDVSASFAGSLERAAAAAARTRLLIVVSPTDEVVDPAPALAFAALSHAQVVQLDGRCGHRATSCDKATLYRAVDAFLESGTANR